jgi:hypothetical protein
MNLGAYGVRYPFVICGFSIVETENVGRLLLLGRAPEARGSEPFFTFGLNARSRWANSSPLEWIADLRLIPLLTLVIGAVLL